MRILVCIKRYYFIPDALYDRVENLKNRDNKHMVYDKNGRIIRLEEASVWTDENGFYVEPKSYTNSLCSIV